MPFHGLGQGRAVPIAGLNTSLELYDKLFSATESKEAVMRRIQTRRSVLDGMKVNANRSASQIAKTDKEKLDEFYQTIRQVELGLKRQLDWANTPKPRPLMGIPTKSTESLKSS